MFFAVANNAIMQDIQAVFTGLGMLLAGWVAWKQFQLLHQSKSNSMGIREVKTIVNGQSTAKDMQIAELARWKACRTGDPIHVAAAESAEKAVKLKLDAEKTAAEVKPS